MTDVEAVLALPRRAGDPRTFTAEEWGEVNGYNAALDEVKSLLRQSKAAALVQVGWMFGESLCAEFGITPLSDEYLITLERADQDGGIKDEYVDRVIPIYRKSPSTAPDDQHITTPEAADHA